MAKELKEDSSALGCLLSGAWTLFSLPFWLGSFVLLVVATTTASKLFALALICFLPIPLNLLHWRKTGRKVATVLLLLAGATALYFCARRAPNYADNPGAAARLVYENGTSHSRLSPANLVPELDQQLLGSYLFSLIDPNLGWRQAAEVRESFRKVYADLERDPDLGPLPSVLGFAYRDMVGLGARPGNLFVYLPPGSGENVLPAIVFLHGSLGSFQGYWILWKKFADANGYAIVAPTFGAGNWERDGGLEAVEQARDFCLDHPRIDGEKLILAGLSNGGKGVSRGGLAHPSAWRGLIFISPVLETSVVGSRAFADGWGGRHALVITGELDKRTTANYVRKAVAAMEDFEMKIEAHYLPGQDHFLMFSDWPQVQKLVEEWMAGL